MDTNQNQPTAQWTEEWLDSVASGASTMSQRKVSSINKRGGGLNMVKTVAQQKGVHLLQLTDDEGNELVAASTKPFTVIC